MTITSATDPLQIGICGWVYVTLKNPTGMDAPRNRLGNLITLSHFDMTATAPGARAVAGV